MPSEREQQAFSQERIESVGGADFALPDPRSDPENSSMGQLFSEETPGKREEDKSSAMRNCLLAFNHVSRKLDGRPSELDIGHLTQILRIGGTELISAPSTTPNYKNSLNLARHLVQGVAEQSSNLTNKSLYDEAKLQLKLLEILTEEKEEALPPNQELYRSCKIILILLDKANERHSLSEEKSLTAEEEEQLRQTLISFTAAGLQVVGEDIFIRLKAIGEELRQYDIIFKPKTGVKKHPKEEPTHLKKTFELLMNLGESLRETSIREKVGKEKKFKKEMDRYTA